MNSIQPVLVRATRYSITWKWHLDTSSGLVPLNLARQRSGNHQAPMVSIVARIMDDVVAPPATVWMIAQITMRYSAVGSSVQVWSKMVKWLVTILSISSRSARSAYFIPLLPASSDVFWWRPLRDVIQGFGIFRLCIPDSFVESFVGPFHGSASISTPATPRDRKQGQIKWRPVAIISKKGVAAVTHDKLSN